MARNRLLVCGTNYGWTYARAITQASDRYEIAGFLAAGSLRSQVLARSAGVPLWRQVDDVPSKDIDAACFALPSDSFEAVLMLLRRGIHVLCEHPRTPEEIEAALDYAHLGAACFHVNAHFGSLPAPSAFVAAAREHTRSAQPAFVRVMTTDRALYSAIDVLAQGLGPVEFDALEQCGAGNIFTGIRGVINGTDCAFEIQSSTRADGSTLPDGSPDYLVDHRITIGFPDGVLTLLSFGGPVVWNANYSRLRPESGLLWREIGPPGTDCTGMAEQRISANIDALDALVKHATKGAIPVNQTAPHLLSVARCWTVISAKLGSDHER